MKFRLLILILLISNSLMAQTKDTKETELEPVMVKDTSGLTNDEVRKIANETDEKTKVKTKDIIDTIIKNQDKKDIDISSLQKPWEELSPKADKYDWIQTKSGEWFKGYIKALYKDKLEFDSDEIGLHVFDFDDISQIKSYQIISVNIEKVAIFKGVIRFKNNKLTIIQGDNKYEFNRREITSLVSEGTKEKDMWSGDITVSFDTRVGNTNSFNGSIKAHIKRRTAKTHLKIDYLGRNSDKDNVQISNDHRVNEKFDIYVTRHFFWTPVLSEFYQNTFKNIQAQYKAGAGMGYVLIDDSKTDWEVSAAPAYIYIEYVSVDKKDDERVQSPAIELSTSLDIKLNKITELEYSYILNWSSDETGSYSHHMVLTLENKLTSWLDFDVSCIWDYTLNPREKENGVMPKKDDLQLLVGLGIEF